LVCLVLLFWTCAQTRPFKLHNATKILRCHDIRLSILNNTYVFTFYLEFIKINCLILTHSSICYKPLEGRLATLLWHLVGVIKGSLMLRFN